MSVTDSVFTFKHFEVKHDLCAMKVGTDSVLLGAWANCSNAQTVLDIGTGTGILALMIAQRCGARIIDAIDINEHAYLQAKENFERSTWQDRLMAYHIALQNYAAGCNIKYDVIICNPPFFIDATKANDNERNIARHINESITFDELAENVLKLLNASGRFCVILPVREGKLFIEICECKGLFCNKITRVRTKTDKVEKRLLIEMGIKQQSEILSNEIAIENHDGSYTQDFIGLTRQFYTHFPIRNKEFEQLNLK